MRRILWFVLWGGMAVLVAHRVVADTLRTVALGGQAIDSGGADEFTINQLGTATLNELGQAALLARVNVPGGGTSIGIWSEGNSLGLKFVARDGAAAPGAPAGAIFSDMTQGLPAINNLGQVAFRGGLVVGQGGVSSSNNSGVWIAGPDEPPQLILREGDQPPGTPAGTQFDAQDDVIQNQFGVFNNAGQVLLRTQLKTGGSVTDMNNTGIWIVGTDQPVAQIARENSTAAGTTDLWANIVATAHINDANQAAFVAPLKFLGSSTGEGIWLRDPTTGVSLITRTGLNAPGIAGAVPFDDLGIPALNNMGDTAVVGSLLEGGAIDTFNNSGIWTKRGVGSLELFVRESDQAPGLPSGAGFGPALFITLNNAGQIAFRSALQAIPGGGFAGITSDNDSAIWAERAVGGLELVAREDDEPPGTSPGVEFASFSEPAFNSHGQVAFVATLRGTGIATTNDNGIWAEDTNGVLQIIVREGDALDVDDGPGVDLRTVAGLFLWAGTGNGDGRRSGFNDNGQLLFSATFTDGNSGIFVSNLVGATLPGDYNQNGIVDGPDYTVWRDTLGLAGASLAADGNLDRIVDVGDNDLWKFHFGESLGGGAAAAGSAGVPEPDTLLLVLVATCTLLATFPGGARSEKAGA